MATEFSCSLILDDLAEMTTRENISAIDLMDLQPSVSLRPAMKMMSSNSASSPRCLSSVYSAGTSRLLTCALRISAGWPWAASAWRRLRFSTPSTPEPGSRRSSMIAENRSRFCFWAT